MGGAHHAVALEQHGGPGHRVACGFGDRLGFAGDHRFVDTRLAGHDHAVRGHALAVLDDQQVAGGDGVDVGVREMRRITPFDAVHIVCGSGVELVRGARAQFDKRLHRLAGAFAGLGLQQAADQHQGDDHADRFEIRLARALREHPRGDAGHQRIQVGGRSAQRDQRVHVGGAVRQRGEADRVDRTPAVEHHRRDENGLQPRVHHPMRHQRGIGHMQHGDGEYRQRQYRAHNHQLRQRLDLIGAFSHLSPLGLRRIHNRSSNPQV